MVWGWSRSTRPDIYSLRDALQFAVFLEHFTIAPYLSALYSIKEGTNVEGAEIIQGVAVEEMLHMILAADILNATGGKPTIGAEEPLPAYPADMPHRVIGFQVNLLRFSKDAVSTFYGLNVPQHEPNLLKPGSSHQSANFTPP